jgi:hypothetical protein
VTLLAAPAAPSTIRLEAATNAANPLFPLNSVLLSTAASPWRPYALVKTYDGGAAKRLTRRGPGKKSEMRRTPFLLLVYLVIGVVVAYAENYLEDVDRTKRLISAALAVVLWPLVLVGFDVKVT